MSPGEHAPEQENVLTRTESRTWARPDCEGIAAGPADAAESPSPAPTPADAPTAATAATVSSIPLVAGLILTSTLRFPAGDRENVVYVAEVTPEGVTYSWSLRERRENGDTINLDFSRFVRTTDLASAPRLDNLFFTQPGSSRRPGYTSFVFSRATYGQVRAESTVPHTVVSLGSGPLDGGPVDGPFNALLRPRVTLKGTLSLESPAAQQMPMLVNGRRVTVPVIHLRGSYAFQEQKQETEYWVLADSTHPIMLRSITGPDTFQTIRIDMPDAGGLPEVERALERECRVELPGIYFDFASANLDPASEPALATVADMLSRHPDWSLTIEGHTDSIGTAASNQALSVRRAEAVRLALIQRGVGEERLRGEGFGETRPREPNATIEGRARNRRVELVRACPGPQG